MQTGVYCIKNLLNGKRYVGSAAKSIARRWMGHRYCLRRGEHKNEHLQRAWNKYGEAVFEFSVLERCPPEECTAKEQAWIDQFDACNRDLGYNKSPTAGSPLGFKHSDETKAKVSEALKGKAKSASHTANIKRGKMLISPATRVKMALYARRRSAEHRKKLSEAMKGNKSCLGRVCSEETKAKIAEKAREQWRRQKGNGG